MKGLAEAARYIEGVPAIYKDIPKMAPLDPDTLLRRDACAAALTEAGFMISPRTLATLACRGGGPPFQKYGRWPLYPWGEALAWAQARLSPLVRSTSEAKAASRQAA